MILIGSQRSGASALADHLMNARDNDHVELLELDGFMADDLHGALAEAQAISKATKCQQYLFSLSLNPPPDQIASEQDFIDAADRIQDKLGLNGQPRAIVIHEKEGRRHAHVVWSRIDAEEMKAINLPHFKRKLRDMARDLYLDHGWELPKGLQRYGNANLRVLASCLCAGLDNRHRDGGATVDPLLFAAFGFWTAAAANAGRSGRDHHKN